MIWIYQPSVENIRPPVCLRCSGAKPITIYEPILHASWAS